jgi:protein-S-isoprenylcysteine O-methyltransferase Ste14
VIGGGPWPFALAVVIAGLLLAFAGVGLMLGNWVGTVGAVSVMVVALIYRLRIEERALTAATGDRYRDFAASRARLIPYV